MLQKFLRIYTIVLSIFILLMIAGAIYGFVSSKMGIAYLCAFWGLLMVFFLAVTRWFIKKNLRKQK